jgi:hypothetical protein
MLTTRAACALIFATFLLVGQAFANDAQWVRPEKADGLLIWGRHDGIVFGLPSTPDWGVPRGLIRVGIYPAGATGPKLLNYIAVEPIVQFPNGGNKGYSEMEQSQLDVGKQGKRLWVDTSGDPDAWKGKITTVPRDGMPMIERLSVPICVERFSINKAYVRLIASVDSDRPNEVRFTVFAQDDSAPIKELNLSATMGNFERLRLVWLADRVLDSRKLAPDYKGKSFTADSDKYFASEMLRLPGGDATVYASSNEANPAAATTAHWPYRLPKLTQYWSVPADEVQPNLRVRVNERADYWKSDTPVSGGIAFENFEVRQKYAPGQTFVFGISPKEPWDLYPGPQKLTPYPQDAPAP